MRLTWLLEMPASMPSAATRSSTLRVDTPCTNASMTTAHRARSMRRRGSSSAGKKLPSRSLGMASSTSPALVDSSRARLPLRCVRARRRCARSGRRRSPGSPRARSAPAARSCIASRDEVDVAAGAQRVEQLGQGRLVEGHRGVLLREPGQEHVEDHAMAPPAGGPSRNRPLRSPESPSKNSTGTSVPGFRPQTPPLEGALTRGRTPNRVQNVVRKDARQRPRRIRLTGPRRPPLERRLAAHYLCRPRLAASRALSRHRGSRIGSRNTALPAAQMKQVATCPCCRCGTLLSVAHPDRQHRTGSPPRGISTLNWSSRR